MWFTLSESSNKEIKIPKKSIHEMGSVNNFKTNCVCSKQLNWMC